ncbi:MAG: hypothetical protein SH820_18470, partial [Xanthomonadales bacterium]|nr:hypothetical protein [Xanthomonadales bacterium]
MSKLFKKTLIVVVLLFGLVSGSISILSGWSLHQVMTKEFEVKGQSLARIIADASITPLLNNQPATLQSMIDEYLGIVGVSHITTRWRPNPNAKGTVCSRSALSRPQAQLSRPCG